MPTPEPLDRLTIGARELASSFPPVLHHPNKLLVHSIACPEGCVHSGTVSYSRWPAFPLPETVALSGIGGRLDLRADLYNYKPVPGFEAGLEWHVNFADPHLFVAYSGSLFAQDEMQVAEHPVLGSLKEALRARGSKLLTVEGGRPTPVLVAGVQRRVRVKTGPNPAEGRPAGLYGNAFARANEKAIRAATVPIDPPTVTNLVAIAAPAGGYGNYTAEKVRHILETAFTGFSAARLETERLKGPGAPVAVHTGFWGCGAFGGNRELMSLLQIVAAAMAGTDLLVFHAHTEAGAEAFRKAAQKVAGFSGQNEITTRDLVASIARSGYAWGVSDGN